MNGLHSENIIHQEIRQIINESIRIDLEKHRQENIIIPLTESHIKQKVRETLRRYLQL